MATENLERIVRYEADTSKAIQQLDALTSATKKNGEALDGVQDQLSGITKRIDFAAAFTGAKEVIGEVAGAIKGVIDYMDDLGNAAQSAGVSITALQGLQYAFIGAGITADQTTKALGKLANDLSKLDDPLNNTSRLLREMGVTAGDTAETALLKISNAFANTEDGINKTAVAMAIFGTELGRKMVPALNQGEQAIKDAAKELGEFGMVTEEDAKKASEFNANLLKMEKLAASVGTAIVSAMLPAMNDWLGALDQAIKKHQLLQFTAVNAWGAISKLSAPQTVVKGVWDFFTEGGKQAEEQAKKTATAAEQAGQAAAAAGEKAGKAGKDAQVPQATLTSLQQWEQRTAAAAKAAREVPAQIDSLRKSIAAVDATTAEGKSERDYLIKQLKSLEDAGKKAGHAKKPELPEFDRWVAGLKKTEEATENVDRKVAYLEEQLASLRAAGEGQSPWAIKLQEVLDKLKPPDAVAQALAKINKEIAAQQDNDKVIAGLTLELEKLAAAGQEASIYAGKVRDKLLELEAAKDPVKKVTLEVQKLEKAMAETEAMNRELLRRLMAGDITPEVFDKLYKGAEKAADSMDKLDKKTVSLSDSIGMQLGTSVTNWTDDLIDNLGRAETSVEDFVETTIKALAKLVLNSYFQQVASAFTGAGGFSGLFASGAAKGAAYDGGLQYMAKGGIIDRPTFFHTSRGMAVGGEAGTEAVVPLRRSSSGDLGVGAVPMEVNVYNTMSDEAEVRVAQRDNTDRNIVDVTIERKVRSMFATGTMDSTMRNSYGLSRQPVRG